MSKKELNGTKCFWLDNDKDTVVVAVMASFSSWSG